MTIKDALYIAITKLKEGNVSEPEKSAEFLLRQVLAPSICHSRPPLSFPRRRESPRRINSGGNLDVRAWMLANPDYTLTKGQEKKFHDYIERRKKHEPVWYITGEIEFYGLDLGVNQSVLVPRPETEFLVEEVLSVIPAKAGIQKKREGLDSRLRGNDNSIRILELGTGSGAISLALANKLKIKIFASDISKDALKVARKNAKNLGLDEFIEFREGDLLVPWKGKKFDIIVANLPYIPHEEMSTLALDIHHFEPRIALDGGKEGLEIYENLLSQIKLHLNKDAVMFFEIGIDQGEKIKSLASKHLPNARVKIKKDYGDIDRIAIIKMI